MVPNLGATYEANNSRGGAKPGTEINDHLDRLLAPDTTLPWYRSIVANITEALYPEALPPLELTSKPLAPDEMPGHELWGLYRAKGSSGVVSIVVHAGLFCLLWSISTSAPIAKLAQRVTVLVAPPPPTHVVEVKPLAGGGGGGGNRGMRSPVAMIAEPPKPIMRHFTPPPPTERPALAIAPLLFTPPEWVGTTDPNVHFGDPLAGLVGAEGNFGTGMGYSGGRGAGFGPGAGGGSGGSWGGGTGSGVGTGKGTGDPVYTSARGMTPPEPIFRPDAEYTDEARKAELSGKVVLTLVVETNGNASEIEVTRALGLGLDQKAIEAVRQWKFKPATIAGKPVRARVNVEVGFRLVVS